MSTATSPKSAAPKKTSRKKSAPTTAESASEAEEKQALLNAEIEKDEKLAESEWELADWFSQNGRMELALRRWQKILNKYPLSSYCPRAKAKLAEHK